MCRLIETIKLRDGIPENLFYHNLRFNNARKDLFGIKEPIDLALEIKIPENIQSGIYKCRVIYGRKIEEIQFIPYQIRQVKNLRIVNYHLINYSYKFLNRDRINYLFSLRGDADDIIIVRDGCITDSSVYNLIFENKDGLFTPSTPLLKGTKREKLLVENAIKIKPISVNDLQKYHSIHLINAFINPGEIVIGMRNITF